jgi:hypothetical protein
MRLICDSTHSFMAILIYASRSLQIQAVTKGDTSTSASCQVTAAQRKSVHTRRSSPKRSGMRSRICHPSKKPSRSGGPFMNKQAIFACIGKTSHSSLSGSRLGHTEILQAGLGQQHRGLRDLGHGLPPS